MAPIKDVTVSVYEHNNGYQALLWRYDHSKEALEPQHALRGSDAHQTKAGKSAEGICSWHFCEITATLGNVHLQSFVLGRIIEIRRLARPYLIYRVGLCTARIYSSLHASACWNVAVYEAGRSLFGLYVVPCAILYSTVQQYCT